MNQRNLYLEVVSVEEARNKLMNALQGAVLSRERVLVRESLDRVTAEPVFARCSSPLFNASAMDGIAVRAAATRDASPVRPVRLREGEDYLPVDTGDPIRPPYDAVIMAEDLVQTPEGLEVLASAAPWEHVRPIGEDIVAGEMILPSRHKVRPEDIGVLLSAGILEIEVLRKPSVAIFPTGTEIIEPEATPGEDSILESNSRMFEALVLQQGGAPLRYGILPDDYTTILHAVDQAVDAHDLVIVNAGSSAGREDFTVHVLRELGEVLVHGVAMKPGKPVILAVVRGKPVIGLPGYPVSAYLAYENFVRPVLETLTGDPGEPRRTVQATLTRRLVSSLRHREYVRVKVGMVDGKMVATPLTRGAGAAMSLVRADGFCIIDQQREGFEAGEEVPVLLTSRLADIRNTLVSIGSHDLILDLLADLMPLRFPGCHLSSTHVGSLAGLMALKRGETHLAPIHLLEEKTGTYNLPALAQAFDQPMALIKGVSRTQGILVKKGNPLGIQSLEDLRRVRYVNRQRGAGTRVLFDAELTKRGIDPSEIQGYDLEAATHMAVAALVASDGADAGLGIFSAAKALDLDFIPVGQEAYDFALFPASLELPLVRHFVALLGSGEFHARLEALGGYTWEDCGSILLPESGA